MKKIFAFSFLLLTFGAYGQDEQRKKDSIALFAPTEAGKPDGEKTSASIGKDGGRLMSSDKRIELIFPAGALSSNTIIIIQPTTNPAVGGIGKGYSLEPSGTQFQKPVQFIYHYTDEEADGDSPELIGLATQDKKGFWLQMGNIKVDTNSKTVTGNINHFSAYVPAWKMILQPIWPGRVKVSKEIRILLAIGPENPFKETTEETKAIISYSLECLFGLYGERKRNWYVNNILNGNNNEGFMINQKLFAEQYKAPAQIPGKNPVKITVEIFDCFFKKPLKRSCYVTVYDNAYEAYEVQMIFQIKSTAGSVLGNVIYKDTGSFVVSLAGNELKVLDIKNNMEYWMYKGSCKIVLQNPSANFGHIHITGIKSFKVTPAQPPKQPYPIIEIVFVQTPVKLSNLLISCPKNKPFSTAAVLGMLPMRPAFPMYIKFIAKEEEQIIQQFGEGGELYLKISVKQIKDD